MNLYCSYCSKKLASGTAKLGNNIPKLCKDCFQIQVSDINVGKKIRKGSLDTDIKNRTFNNKRIEDVIVENEYCEHGNLVYLGCQLCDPSRLEKKRKKKEKIEEYLEERCHLCDTLCARKIGNKTWKCPICNYRSTWRSYRFDFTGHSEDRLSKLITEFRTDHWHKVPKKRKEWMAKNVSELTLDYYNRMLPFFRFESTFRKEIETIENFSETGIKETNQQRQSREIRESLDRERFENSQITGKKETNEERNRREEGLEQERKKREKEERLEQERFENSQITGKKETNEERIRREKMEEKWPEDMDERWRKLYYNPHRIDSQALYFFFSHPIEEIMNWFTLKYPNPKEKWSIEKISESYDIISQRFSDTNGSIKLSNTEMILIKLEKLISKIEKI